MKSKQYHDDLSKTQEANSPKVPPAQRKIDHYTKGLENRTKKLEERIAKGDFERKTREERQLDGKAKVALFQYEQAKKRWNEGLHKALLKKRHPVAKVLDAGRQGINLARSMQTGGLGDFTAVLNQGGFITFGAPIRASKSIIPMLKAWASPYQQFKVMNEIESRDSYQLMKQSKLALTSDNGSLNKMEEAYMSRWIPPTPLKKGQPIRNVARATKNVLTFPNAAAERAYVTFLNKLRADSFDALSRGWYNGKPTLEEARQISGFINDATGRSSFGKAEGAAPVLNTALFAPRFLFSRARLLTGAPMWGGTWKSRRMIATQYVKYAIGVSVFLGLLRQAGARIGTDPLSSDYGKAIIGNTRINVGSGLPQLITFISRLFSGQTRNSKGKLLPLRDSLRPFDKSSAKVEFGQRDMLDVGFGFGRSKASPILGAGINIAAAKDVLGRPTTPGKEALRLVTPMTSSDIITALRDERIPSNEWRAFITLVTALGGSSNTYDSEKSKKD